MKIEYWSHCFNDGINFKNLAFYSQNEENAENIINKHSEDFRNLMIKMINKSSRNSLEDIYRWEISHDYDGEIKLTDDEIIQEVLNYIKKYNFLEYKHSWSSFFELAKHLISSHGKCNYCDTCEQCGDYNESYEWNI